MSDFFDRGSAVSHTTLELQDIFQSIYGTSCNWNPRVFVGLNLHWPHWDFPQDYDQYLITFHTEYLNLDWIIKQARRVYPRPVLLVSDYNINISHPWPDNIQSVQYLTLHKQINTSVREFGIVDQILKPQYKLSSLTFRVTQYKKFITAYLLKNFPTHDMILTYHNQTFQSADHHGYPPGIDYLDQLDIESLTKTLINFDDGYNVDINHPVANSVWTNPAYQQALVNCTNESFHYSQTVYEDCAMSWPGPYLTEKTIKPLIAGRPFLAVGQQHTYQRLNELGFRTDFGFDISYDQDPGDLTRIGKIFNTVDDIQRQSIDQLFDASIDAVTHNVNLIRSGELFARCEDSNRESTQLIVDFLSK